MRSDLPPPPIEIPDDWQLVRLKDICTKIGSGSTPTGGQAAYLKQRTQYALVRSQNVFDRAFSINGLAYISNDQASKLKGVDLQENDILLNITGDGITFGRACLVNKEILPACVNQHVSIIRVSPEKADPGYVLSFLTHPAIKEYIESFNSGGSRRAITKGHIESFVVPLPSIDEQHEIANTLSIFDTKITLLQETNSTLESIAQALFKSWFVDFAPVRSKAEGREPEGLPPDIADLFPDEFEESELGVVPKGWKIMPLEQACEINPTRRLSKGNEAKYLEMAALPIKGHRPDTPFLRAFSSGTKFTNGDTLLARITPCLENGKTAFVDFLSEDEIGWGSTEYIVLRSKSPLPEYWSYLLSRHQPFRQFAIQAMAGTSGRQRVDVSRLAQYFVAVPDTPICVTFASLVQPLQLKIRANDESIKSLKALRDNLLPKLMSGKLRIPATNNND